MPLAWDLLTGMKRVVVSSLCRDLTIYLVLIEAVNVGFIMALRLDRVEPPRILVSPPTVTL